MGQFVHAEVSLHHCSWCLLLTIGCRIEEYVTFISFVANFDGICAHSAETTSVSALISMSHY